MMEDPVPWSASNDPPNGGDELVKKEEDERTVSTVNSDADDASLQRAIQALLEGNDSTKDLAEQNSIRSGCTGCTGDDTLSLAHACKVIIQEIECIYRGYKGRSCITNDRMLPYVCWPNDDDSDFSSIAKDDASKTSGISSSVKDRSTEDSTSVKDDSTKDSGVKDNPPPESSAEAKKETAVDMSDKKTNSIFFWRTPSKSSPTALSEREVIAQVSDSFDAPPAVAKSNEDSPTTKQQDELSKDVIIPSVLERQRSIPETVSTCLSQPSAQGIEVEDLSDDESKNEPVVELSIMEEAEQGPTLGEHDSSPSGKSSRSGRAIFGKVKRAISKSSLNWSSANSHGSEPKNPATVEDVENQANASELSTHSEVKDIGDTDATEQGTSPVVHSDGSSTESTDKANIHAPPQEPTEVIVDTESTEEKSGKPVGETPEADASRDLDTVESTEPELEPTSNEVSSPVSEATSKPVQLVDTAPDEASLPKPSILGRVRRSFAMSKPPKHETMDDSSEESIEIAKPDTLQEVLSDDISRSEETKDPNGTDDIAEAVGVNEEETEDKPTKETSFEVLEKEAVSVSVQGTASNTSSPSDTDEPSAEDRILLSPIVLDRVRRSIAKIEDLLSESSVETECSEEKSLADTQNSSECSDGATEPNGVQDGAHDDVKDDDVTDTEVTNQDSVATENQVNAQDVESIKSKNEDSTEEMITSDLHMAKLTEQPELSSDGENATVLEKASLSDDIDHEDSIPDSILPENARREEYWFGSNGLLCHCSSGMKNESGTQIKNDAVNHKGEKSLINTDNHGSALEDANPAKGLVNSVTERETIAPTANEESFADPNILVKIKSSFKSSSLLLHLLIDVEDDEPKTKDENSVLQDASVHGDAVSISSATVVTNNTRSFSVLKEIAAENPAFQEESENNKEARSDSEAGSTDALMSTTKDAPKDVTEVLKDIRSKPSLLDRYVWGHH